MYNGADVTEAVQLAQAVGLLRRRPEQLGAHRLRLCGNPSMRGAPRRTIAVSARLVRAHLDANRFARTDIVG
ncbi:MAG: hypothetical protein R3C56_20580 [Pirellulaceae bacterium]